MPRRFFDFIRDKHLDDDPDKMPKIEGPGQLYTALEQLYEQQVVDHRNTLSALDGPTVFYITGDDFLLVSGGKLVENPLFDPSARINPLDDVSRATARGGKFYFKNPDDEADNVTYAQISFGLSASRPVHEFVFEPRREPVTDFRVIVMINQPVGDDTELPSATIEFGNIKALQTQFPDLFKLVTDCVPYGDKYYQGMKKDEPNSFFRFVITGRDNCKVRVSTLFLDGRPPSDFDLTLAPENVKQILSGLYSFWQNQTENYDKLQFSGSDWELENQIREFSRSGRLQSEEPVAYVIRPGKESLALSDLLEDLIGITDNRQNYLSRQQQLIERLLGSGASVTELTQLKTKLEQEVADLREQLANKIQALSAVTEMHDDIRGMESGGRLISSIDMMTAQAHNIRRAAEKAGRFLWALRDRN